MKSPNSTFAAAISALFKLRQPFSRNSAIDAIYPESIESSCSVNRMSAQANRSLLHKFYT
jgi:hypothetical protein